jgi:hypothetical protein
VRGGPHFLRVGERSNIILSFGAASKLKFCKLCVKMPNAKVGLVEEWVHERVRPKFPAKSTYRVLICKISACGLICKISACGAPW